MPRKDMFSLPGAASAIACKAEDPTGEAVLLGEELRRAVRFLQAAGIDSAEIDAQVLLAGLLGCDRSRLFSGDQGQLDQDILRKFRHQLVRRAGRLPIPYITGKREFWSCELRVDGRVLVPRPETELLVEAVLEKMTPQGRLLDVGTGSGNIVVAVAGQIEGSGWVALDISQVALEVAASNLVRYGYEDRISLRRSDLFEALEDGEAFDVVVSNPPYIPTGEISTLAAEIRCHEPRVALDGGEGGLELIRRIIADSCRHVVTGGWLILEFGAGQESQVEEIFRNSRSFGRPSFRRDLSGHVRVAAARRS